VKRFKLPYVFSWKNSGYGEHAVLESVGFG
jgi:hypothetical protein